MAVNQLVLIGDSLVANAPGNFGYQNVGGLGTWPQLTTDRLGNIPGLGPLAASGIHMAHAFAQGDWSFTTGGNAWTGTVSTDAWDKSLYGTFGIGVPSLFYAVGSGKVATNTAGTDLRYPNVGWELTWVDYASGTSATPAYSTDGGSSWTDFPDAPSRNNAVRKFYVASPRTLGSTVKIRGANSAGTNAGVAPIGIQTFYQTPSSASGLIVHNWGVGGSLLNNLVASSSGDRMAMFDSVVLGSGSPITNTPNLGTVVLHINDIQIASDTTWGTDLTTFNTRVSPLGPVGILSAWEADTANFNQTQQTAYRAKTKTIGAGFSTPAKLLDIYDALAAQGVTGNAQTVAAGLLYDGTHPAQLLQLDLARRVYWWLRSKFLSSYASRPSVYTTSGKRAAVAYSGKQATVQYAAGNQIAALPV